jgi:RNA polymerase sigma-70 factor, ECF subfamily
VPRPSVVPPSTATSLRAAPPLFVCTWEAGNAEAAWVHVVGELDLATSPELCRTLHDARRYARLVVLDLREVTFMEASAQHVIHDGARDARRTGGRLIIVRGPAAVDRSMTLTGACDEVEIFDLDPSLPAARALEDLAQKGERGMSLSTAIVELLTPDDVKQSVQEAFISMWNGRASYLPRRGTVAAWLLTAVRYRAIDLARPDHGSARERTHPLQELLAKLPNAQREVITLASYGELSHAEIAATLDLPDEIVKSRIRLGLNTLRETVESAVA